MTTEILERQGISGPAERVMADQPVMVNSDIRLSRIFIDMANELSVSERVRAWSMVEGGVRSWMRVEIRRDQYLENQDVSIPPVFRVDTQQLRGQRQISVFLQRQDGPIEDSEFRIKTVFATENLPIVLEELKQQGFGVECDTAQING